MKPLINQLSDIAAIVLLPFIVIRKKKNRIMIGVLFIITIVLAGCYQKYFRAVASEKIDAETIHKWQSLQKYFIVHFNNGVMAMDNVKIINENLEADLSPLPAERKHYVDPIPDRPNVVKLKHMKETILEVHMYYTGTLNTDSAHTHISVPLSAFSRANVYEFDMKATRKSSILSTVGIVWGVASIVGFIVIMTACNCPQVYIDNNNGGYEFAGGVYSGAIYSSMERTDYLPLPVLQSGTTVKMKISNVENEEQYINQMQLMKVSHRPGTKVLIDRHGNLFTNHQPEAPLAASMGDKTDIKKTLIARDQLSYRFDNERNEDGFSSVILTFPKPTEAKKAKLVAHGGNSLWSGYIYHSFASLFGEKYEAWRQLKDNSDPAEMEKWQKDQSLPLMVYVERNGKWEFADYFAHTGNTATRDLIMELDLSHTGSDYVKIKLETAYQFWNLDYTGMDFSENENFSIQLINPLEAIKTGNNDVCMSLKEKDKAYVHLTGSEEIKLEFMVSDEDKNMKASYYLISTGYYHNMQKYAGSPDLIELNKFLEKASFDAYSRKKFSIMEDVIAKSKK
jgi:hypothetical protein